MLQLYIHAQAVLGAPKCWTSFFFLTWFKSENPPENSTLELLCKHRPF